MFLATFRFFLIIYTCVLCPTAFHEIISLFQGLFGHLRVWDMILFDWVGRCRYQTGDIPHKRIQTLTNAFSYITVNVIQKSKNLYHTWIEFEKFQNEINWQKPVVFSFMWTIKRIRTSSKWCQNSRNTLKLQIQRIHFDYKFVDHDQK